MTAVLCIDCRTGLVRRYATRRPGGMPRVTDEGIVVWESPTLEQGLEAFRAESRAAAPAAFPQDHIPPGAA